jgi:hypothetical protein
MPVEIVIVRRMPVERLPGAARSLGPESGPSLLLLIGFV